MGLKKRSNSIQKDAAPPKDGQRRQEGHLEKKNQALSESIVQGIPEHRPLLIFNHNPKAGGGSILAVLRGFKQREVSCYKKAKKATASGSGCKIKNWQEVYSSNNNTSNSITTSNSIDNDNNITTSNATTTTSIDDVFVHFREFTRTTPFDRTQGFVIGSIREPCSQYVSLWSWASLGNGEFRKETVTDQSLYGRDFPYFNTSDDKERFQKWMEHPKVSGIVGNRVRDSYGENVLDTVDCWVFVEDFSSSLLECLYQYDQQGGYVDWNASTIVALLEQQEQQQQHGQHNNNTSTRALSSSQKMNRIANKNDYLGDPRTKHHGKCDTMYDTKLANFVETNTDSFVYDLFGYEKCCKPGNAFGTKKTATIIASTTSATEMIQAETRNDTDFTTANPTQPFVDHETLNQHVVYLFAFSLWLLISLSRFWCKPCCDSSSDIHHQQG